MRKLACAFFDCSISPINSDQMRHKGGSKRPHFQGAFGAGSKNQTALGETPGSQQTANYDPLPEEKRPGSSEPWPFLLHVRN
jgi:hypothetical protein